MNQLIDYIISNKEWIFSGAGVLIISTIITFIYKKIYKKKKEDINDSGNIANVKGKNNITIIGDTIQFNPTLQKIGSLLELVDLSIDESEEYPILDFKLRNIGDEIAFIKGLEFIIYDYYRMNNIYMEDYRRIESNHTYDVLLSGNKNEVFQISQAIKPNDVDRFKVKIASNNYDAPYLPTVCYFSTKVIFNKNSFLESKKMVVAISPIDRIGGRTIRNVNLNIAFNDYKRLCEFMSYNDAMFSRTFIALHEKYKTINEKHNKKNDRQSNYKKSKRNLRKSK